MIGDTRLALRVLLRSRGYTVAIVGVLALAIAANTSIFSLVYAVLLKPLPIRDPQMLVVVWDSDPARNLPVVELSYRTFQTWIAHSRSLASTAVMGSSAWSAILRNGGALARVASCGVSASFFDTVDVKPFIGRALLPADDVPNAPAVAVLSYRAWLQHFGADRHIVGKTMQVDTTRTIVGVMPPDFDFPRGTSYWFPVVPLLASVSKPGFDAFSSVGVLFVVGRLQPGASPAMARVELDRLATIKGQDGQRRFGSAMVVTPFLDYLIGPVRQGLWALWTAVGLLLLIACANVSALMLNRASIHSREHAIRAALGASGRALARLWLTQAAILAALSGITGLAAAWGMTRIIVTFAPPDVPRVADASINPTVALFVVVLVLMVAAMCGVAPARRAGRENLIDTLNDAAHGTPGRRRQRARFGLLVFQVALSVVLLVSAGLVVRSFLALGRIDPGFVPYGVLTMFVGPASNDEIHELVERLETMPKVQAAGAVYLRPLELGPVGLETSARLEGQTAASARENPTLNFQAATPGYFRAMRIRLVSGRIFSEQDRANTDPVVLVGETAGRALWHGDNPVGKRLLLNERSKWATVVGVVRDVHYRGLGDPRLDVYEAASQSPNTSNYVVALASGDPLALVSRVQIEARRLGPTVTVDSIATLEGIVSRAIAPWRFTSWILGLLASLAFLLTVLGLVSLVSLEVANRRQELAIRLTVGARTSNLLQAVLIPAVLHALAGLAAGALSAVVLTKALRGLLFHVEPLDPVAWIVALTAVMVVVILAAYLPARRAAHVDPLVLLRK